MARRSISIGAAAAALLTAGSVGLAPAGALAAGPLAPHAGARAAASAGVSATARAGVSAAPRCAAVRPSRLTLARRIGAATAVLRWRVPRNATTRASGRRAVRYRVMRDRSVVGQTAKHAIRLRVTVGARHRFAVVPLAANGKPTPCRTQKRVRVAYRAPGAPRYVAVEGDEGGLRLSWRAGARGDGALAGYRLVRDGATVGQTRDTSWNVNAEANRTYRFAVVAVDRGGRTSRPSRTVAVTTGHAPPTAPAGLQALAISDTQLGAQWQPSTVRSGEVTAYRVLRDGAVVGQVAATSTILGNLAPSTDYEVAVVAIDSHGYASAPAVVSGRTNDPTPTSGHAHAFLLASTDQSFADFRAHYRQIGVVHPTYFDCTGDAALIGRDDPLVTRWSQARRVEVLPRVNCQRTAVVSRILTDPATRAAWLDRLVGLAREGGYDGISLDFEAGPAADRAAMTSFVRELAGRLHADGRKLAISVSSKAKDSLTHPRSGIFDYPRLSEAADYVFLMAWGIHWATSAPGPQDEIGWVRSVVDYVKTLPLKHKFVYGTNLYAMDWPNGGGPDNRATAYEYQEAMGLLGQVGAQTALDPATDNLRATYTDAAGVPHEVWYPDAQTTARRVRLAKEAGLGGVGFWRLGREDQRIWDDPLLAPGAPW
jgi:spore germination protein YaaH